MKIRSTVILFGLFAVAILVFAAFQWLGIQTGEESKHAERFVFPSLNPYTTRKEAPPQPGDPNTPQKTKGPQQAQPDQFTRLVIERHLGDAKKTERLEFNRVPSGKNFKWMLVSPVKVRTDDNAVTNLIKSLISLEKQKARDIGRDLGKLGLDTPSMTVTLTRSDKPFVLSLGSTGPSTSDPVYFAISSDVPGKPFLLPKSRIEKAFDDVANFRDKSLISSSFGIVGLKLGGTARSAMDLSKDQDWSFKEPAIGLADTPATDEYARQLSAIRVERNEDFLVDAADAAKLAQYGLSDDKPAYALTLTQSPVDIKDKPVVEKLLVGNADDSAVKQASQVRTAALVLESLASPTGSLAAYYAREKQKVEPAYYYARLEGDTTVVRIPARHLPALQKQADELRSKTLAKIDNSKVDSVQYTSQNETVRIYRPDMQGAASWDMYSDTRARVKCQPQAIQGMLDMITRVEVREAKAYLDDDAKIKAWFENTVIDLGLDKPVATIQIWQEGILRDTKGVPEGAGEPKLREDLKGKPTIKLSIGRKDDQRKVTYVRREQPGLKPVVLAVPDPFVAGNVPLGATQSGAVPPDGRQNYSISSLAGKGYLAFRDRTLPSYRPDQVASLEVKRAEVTYLLEQSSIKDEQGKLESVWKMKQPVEAATNPGVADFLVTNLVSTSTDKLITDNASEKDLETFGLTKSPLIQLVVKTKADDKPADPNNKDAVKPHPGGTFIYTVGKKLADNAKYPNHYYARVEVKMDGVTPDSNKFVMAVPAHYLQMIDLELRDGIVFAEDKGKPASMTVTWNGESKDKKPQVTILELALGEKQWEVKKLTQNDADAKATLTQLDQAKINGLLRYGTHATQSAASLNPWIVERYYQHTGKIDPKLRLDPKDKANPPRMVIDVKYADGKTRTVIFGETIKSGDKFLPAMPGSTFFFAATPSLPGAVVLVNELYWKEMVGGAEYFAAKAAKPPQ